MAREPGGVHAAALALRYGSFEAEQAFSHGGSR